MVSATGEVTDLSNLPDVTAGNIKEAEKKKLFFILHINFLKHTVLSLENGQGEWRNSNLNIVHSSEQGKFI